MYNYHADIVWIVNVTLAGIILATIAVIFLCAIFKDYLWEKRSRILLNIKKNVYEMVLAGNKTSENVCQSFVAAITPQQFIDISTNRSLGVTFFNDAEQQFLRGCFGSPVETARLRKIALNYGNKWRRIEAILALGYARVNEALEVLKHSILSKDKDIAYFSMLSLGQIKTLESAGIFLDFLKKEPSLGSKIVSILENFPKEITEDVIKLTDYHDVLVRLWALKLLSKFPDRKYIRELEKLTHDASDEVRATACECLGNIGDKEAAPTLIGCLKDENWHVRQHAVLALASVSGDAALPKIISLISDGSWSVIDAVKDVMASHIEASLPYIERFLSGKDELAKKYSVMALQNSGYIVKLLTDLISGKNKDFAIRLLKGVIASREHYGLDAALTNLEPSTRAKALEELVRIEEK